MATQFGPIQNPRVVAPEQWVTERVAFLAKEKELVRLGDELSRRRRELPWVRVEKPYVFHGPNGEETLAQLFEGRSQLLVYHFMFGPEMKEACPSCSYVADHFDATLPHLTYSTYGRGVEALMGTYSYLDLMPKGRDEEGLDYTMAWVRYHDRYED